MRTPSAYRNNGTPSVYKCYARSYRPEMNSIMYFLWLLSMTPGLILYLWQGSLVLAILTGTALFIWAKKKPIPSLRLKLLIANLLYFLIFLCLGTIFRAGENWTALPYSNAIINTLLVLLVLQIILAGASVFLTSTGSRFLTSTVVVWGIYFSLSAAFISGMSISGDWL